MSAPQPPGAPTLPPAPPRWIPTPPSETEFAATASAVAAPYRSRPAYVTSAAPAPMPDYSTAAQTRRFTTFKLWPWMLVAVAAVVIVYFAAGALAGKSTNNTKALAASPAAATPSGADSPSTSNSPVAVNSAGLLAGTAKPNFPAGIADKVDVVATGPLVVSATGDGTLPIALRNNTGEAVGNIAVAATARDSSGTPVATGTSQGVDPGALQPGEVGLSVVYFHLGSTVAPTGATYSFQATSQQAGTASDKIATLKVAQVNAAGSTIVGTAINTTGKTLQGPYSVNAYCFDASGNLTSMVSTFANALGNLAANGSATFTVDFGASPACNSYLVGSTGYFG